MFIGSERADVIYSGLTTVFPGVWLIDAVVPAAAAVAGQMPVFVTLGGVPSNAVTFWVAR